ncbi:retrovirus-related pol polyprotein from transposon TNT 1-94 [Tanacetum coccineum]|uniref:Retrovirus-related pol polyprotein from transposon TNT 1-94 n=1 Tax=Tanacetum coccineum TaxID=301880 RepID=A0ABQ4Z6H4_9ASTR
MRENDKEEKVKHEMGEIKTINIESEHSVAKLLSENERLHKEIEHLKKIYKDQFDSIKKTRSLSKEHWKETVENAAQIPIATTIAPGMFKIDLEPLAPRLLNNREAHIDYLKHTQEQADILWGIVKQAKAKQLLNNTLDFACKHAKRIQELLVYVRDTCPNTYKPSEKLIVVTPMNKVKKVRFSEPLTSSSNIQQVESSKTPDSNTPVLSSTGLKCSTSTCRSQPTGNKRNDRILQTPSSNIKNKVVQIVLWYLDSGCSKHMTGNRSQLMNFVSKFLGTVRFRNDQVAKIMGYGDYQQGNVIISRVYYVEGLRHNLFSVGQFCDADLEVAFRKNTCFIRNLEGVDLLSGSRDTNLYTISLDDMLKTSPICLLSKASKTKSWLWHRRLSHLNFACALGKSKKSSHQPKAEDTNQEKLYLLHMDLCGLMHVESINGKKYSLTLRVFYENVGILHQISVARTPQWNGVVERRNRTLMEAAHTMLIFSKAHLFLWAEAINTACYTQNHSLIRLRYNKTPYELMHNKKPDLSFFQFFGSLCYPTNDS